jgi:hypothetical protein
MSVQILPEAVHSTFRSQRNAAAIVVNYWVHQIWIHSLYTQEMPGT